MPFRTPTKKVTLFLQGCNLRRGIAAKMAIFAKKVTGGGRAIFG